ncbi:hypothetical protein [Amycolatopsis nigrescens]|uniref:hypothetical protein n=1 Tax=Amycolatopsis nigrescens TaxID=381445 RepID=UPI0012F7F202|nr:hypothetical protein [Amycolatopsis nigrescens]
MAGQTGERQVVSVLLGAGSLVAFAAAAAVAGWWTLGGIVLAGLLAVGAARIAPETPSTVDSMPLALCAAAARLAALPLCAGVFAAYLVPDAPVPAVLVFVLVLTVADAIGAGLPGHLRGWILGLLVLAAAALAALCLTITPAEQPATGTGPGAAGLPLAAVLFFPLLRPVARRGYVWWVAGGVLVALVVGAAALYQLGPIRLGLSATSLRDLLSAADGRVLEPWLAGVVLAATVPAGLVALAGARAELGERLPRVGLSAACGAVAALFAVLLEPVEALWLLAALALAETGSALLARRYRRQRD